MQKIILSKRNKKISVSVKELSFLGKFRGLMFRKKNSPNLLFVFENSKTASIHSIFVFFPFLAVWLNKKNKLIKKEIVKPFRIFISAPLDAKKLVEIPLNSENKKILSFFDVKAKV